jgi:hypothetical protein
MKKISIGALFLGSLSLMGMESDNLPYTDFKNLPTYIEQLPYWSENQKNHFFSLLSKKAIIPNYIELTETNRDDQSTYDATYTSISQDTLDLTEYTNRCMQLYPDDYIPEKYNIALSLESNNKYTLHFFEPDSQITSIASSFDRNTLAIGQINGSLAILSNQGNIETRDLSFKCICSVAFDSENNIIATDADNKVYLFNRKTNVVLCIKSNKIKCPLWQEDRIIIIDQHTFKPSTLVPFKFFNHEFTDPQYQLLLKLQKINVDQAYKNLEDSSLLPLIQRDLAESGFEPTIKEMLGDKIKKLYLSSNNSTPSFFAASCSKLKQWYTKYIKKISETNDII